MDLMEYIGNKIKELRVKYAGNKGISQEVLAKELDVVPNTISRWETATYKPSIEDLDRLARFFKISILEFFPTAEKLNDTKMNALLRAVSDLPADDIDELQRYAEFRRARNELAHYPGKKEKKAKKTE